MKKLFIDEISPDHFIGERRIEANAWLFFFSVILLMGIIALGFGVAICITMSLVGLIGIFIGIPMVAVSVRPFAGLIYGLHKYGNNKGATN